MNFFFGSFHSAGSQQAARNQEASLRKRFPRACAPLTSMHSGSLSLTGIFDTDTYADASGSHTEIFFNGLLFNAAALKRKYGITNIPKHNPASLIAKMLQKAGEQAILEINGQFLLLLHRKEKNALSIYTDHSGVRQLFYGHFGGSLVFGSELKLVLAHHGCSGKIDWDFSLRHPHAGVIVHSFRDYGTWFQGIRLLPQATELRYSAASPNPAEHTYLNLVSNDFWQGHKKKYRSADEVREAYFALLEDAVRLRIGQSDTAYSFLSGGLDSTIVAALAAKYKPTGTFSAVTRITLYEGTTGLCKMLAGRQGFTNHQYIVPLHRAMADPLVWRRLVWGMESPMNHVDALTKSMLHHAIRSHHPQAKQVMTGTGSDDLNGGYVHWLLDVEDSRRKDRWDIFEEEILDGDYRRRATLTEGDLWRRRKMIDPNYIGSSGADLMQLYALASLYSNAYHLIWDEVRAGSAQGHEVLFPFLDYRFYGFIAGIPSAMYPELFYDKSILRIPSRRLLPKIITEKKKVPIDPPAKYDNYITSYEKLITARRYALLEEAFGSLDAPHEVIDKKGLVRMVSRNPGTADWNHIMHVINLGLLEQLQHKSEADLDLEAAVGDILPVQVGRGRKWIHTLERQLDMDEAVEETDIPVFAEDTRFLTDKESGCWYLSKDEKLSYEIHPDHKEWLGFLRAVDGKRTIGQILKRIGKKLSDVEEFLRPVIEEEILLVRRG